MRISDWSSDVCSSDLPGQVMERSPWMLGSSPSMTIARMMESPTAAALFPLCSPHHQCSPCTAQQGGLLYNLTGTPALGAGRLLTLRHATLAEVRSFAVTGHFRVRPIVFKSKRSASSVPRSYGRVLKNKKTT